MKAKKTESGKWRVRAFWTENGRQHAKSFTADKKAEAERMAAEFMEHRAEYNSDNPTVKDCIDRYISSKSPVLSPSTIAGYRKYQRLYYSSLNGMKVLDVTQTVLQKWVNEMSESDISVKTLKNAFGLLNASLRPYSRNASVTLPSAPQRTPTTPDDKMVSELIKSARMPLRLAICIAAFGTARAGEICAIKYDDINGCMIHIHADLVKDECGCWVYKPFPKTRQSDRYIELPEQVIDMIPPKDESDYIVPLKPSAINSEFRKLRNKLGYNCRFHDLRHYAASFMHSLGIPDAYIMKRGGWSSDYTLKRVYRNTLSSDEKKYSDLANSHFLEI